MRQKQSKKAIQSTQSIKKIESQTKVKKKPKFDFGSDDSVNVSVSEQISSSSEEENIEKITIDPFNADKVYFVILNKANKEPEFLIMLKNLMSGGVRSLDDKKKQLDLKWKKLKNSNCTQEEYMNRVAELNRMKT